MHKVNNTSKYWNVNMQAISLILQTMTKKKKRQEKKCILLQRREKCRAEQHLDKFQSIFVIFKKKKKKIKNKMHHFAFHKKVTHSDLFSDNRSWIQIFLPQPQTVFF